MKELKNEYFILRHGQTTHQTERSHIVYYWPEDKPPASLTKEGQEQIKKRAEYLKDKNIDLIFTSDVLRTRETAEIIAKELGLEVKHDTRLRDINWGIYQGKPMKEAWSFYKRMEEKFTEPPPEGESWEQARERMIDFLKEVDGNYEGKNILIVSHGDPLWLLEGWVRDLSNKELAKQKKEKSTIRVGELRKVT
jgi:broad specificity phosphatase PhoE